MTDEFTKLITPQRCPCCQWTTIGFAPVVHTSFNVPPDTLEDTRLCLNRSCENFAGNFERAADLPKMEYRPAEDGNADVILM